MGKIPPFSSLFCFLFSEVGDCSWVCFTIVRGFEVTGSCLCLKSFSIWVGFLEVNVKL